VDNGVLAHALEVEANIERLKEAVAKTGATHERDLENEMLAETKLEVAFTAYADLTTAMEDLATCTNISKESLKIELAAKEALNEYKDREAQKTQKSRCLDLAVPIFSTILA
jgi:hypothetical protein